MDAEVDAIIDDVENKRTRRCWSADNLGRWLGLTYAVRTALRASCDRLDRERLSQQSDEDGRLVCWPMTT